MSAENGGGKKYYGKYGGVVQLNTDPDLRGRITATVPDVFGPGVPCTWAEPCLPVTGIQSGAYMLPAPGTAVWIEFQGGDPQRPIWSGCYWGKGEVPPLALAGAPVAPNIMLQTVTQNSLLISGNPATGIMLQLASKAGIVISEAGIVIQNGKGASISLVGPTVSINPPALVVT
jgi:type VI secretion system (T6SS) baseplate-like injector VgrG